MCRCLFDIAILLHVYEQHKVYILCLVQYNILDFNARKIIIDLYKSVDFLLCNNLAINSVIFTYLFLSLPSGTEVYRTII
jgi:hypothetical protein